MRDKTFRSLMYLCGTVVLLGSCGGEGLTDAGTANGLEDGLSGTTTSALLTGRDWSLASLTTWSKPVVTERHGSFDGAVAGSVLLSGKHASAWFSNAESPGSGNPYSMDLLQTDGIGHGLQLSRFEGTDRDCGFGSAMQLTTDEDMLVIGASCYSTQCSTFDLPACQSASSVVRAGAVLVYRHQENGWLRSDVLEFDDRTAFDELGAAVAVSGDGVIIAAGDPSREPLPIDFTACISCQDRDHGAVDIFVRQEDGHYRRLQTLYHPFAEDDDQFGISLALSGDGSTLVVGDPRDLGAGSGVFTDVSVLSDPGGDTSRVGAVLVFRMSSDGLYAFDAVLKPISDHVAEFGRVLAIAPDGQTIAVRSTAVDGLYLSGNMVETDNSEQGELAIYRRTATGWQPSQRLRAPSDHIVADGFGACLDVSTDGQILAVGMPDYEDDLSFRKGAVFVYRLIENVYQPSISARAPDPDVSQGQFGCDLDLDASGRWLVAGDSADFSSGSGIEPPMVAAPAVYGSGAVFLFDLGGG